MSDTMIANHCMSGICKSQKLSRWQHQLAKQVILQDHVGEVKHVAGVDMAINEEHEMARAAVVLLTYPALEIVEKHVYEEPYACPYVPGLLSFREAPSVLGALTNCASGLTW